MGNRALPTPNAREPNQENQINALAIGKTELLAKHKGKIVAKLWITVSEKLTLPLPLKPEGVLVRGISGGKLRTGS